MRWYRADLHIHSVLSPCGDLDMSPVRIIHEAKNKKLDIIAITDHNHTGHANLMMNLGLSEGIVVFPGVELNTREEIHCLAFFENIGKTEEFQQYLNAHYTEFDNQPNKFGHQLIVNEQEEILKEVNHLLITGLTAGINEIEKKVHQLDGVFIPAHIDRKSNSILTQLGFIPDDLFVDALELSYRPDSNSKLFDKPNIKSQTIIFNSDAHIPENIGKTFTEYYMQAPTFNEWKRALKEEGNRKIR
jgi:PHP family Zn ribbon phosphoesterase